ncbi:MAG: hypothetical protein ACI849_000460 [Patiriisocius sp.]|jgi:hypothetical protein
MRKIILSLSLIVSSLMSCGSDDDASNNNNTANTTDYFPLTANTSWTYSNSGEDLENQDTMFVNGTEQTNGNEHTNIDTQEEIATGFMIGILTQNLVRKEIGKLIINGSLHGAPIEGFPDISIPLNDVILYDANASSGVELSTLSGTIEETVMDFPFIVNYTSTSLQGEALTSYTAGTQTYTDVIRSRIMLNLKINTEIQIGSTTINIPILAAQDVLWIDNYYAANTGLVFSEATVDYMLEDLGGIPGIEIPFPEQSTTVTTSTITSFEIGN